MGRKRQSDRVRGIGCQEDCQILREVAQIKTPKFQKLKKYQDFFG